MLKLLFALICLLALTGLPAQARQTLEKLDTGIANVYLLRADKPILVDASAAGHEAEIESWLKNMGIAPQDLALIVLTHGHVDHAGGASYFHTKYQTPVLVGRGDLPLLQTGRMPELAPTSLLAGLVRVYVDPLHFEPFEPSQIIDQEISLKAYGINARVVPLPHGHTAGSLAVILDDSHEAIIGDLVRGDIWTPGVAVEHFFHENRQRSRWQLWHLLHNYQLQTLHPGHFGSFSADEAMKKFFPQGKFRWP